MREAATAMVHRKLFARMDRRSRNQVTSQELRDSGLLRKVVPELTAAAEQNIFDHADQDGDGVLSRIEARGLFDRIMQAPGAEDLLSALVANDLEPPLEPGVASGAGVAPPEPAPAPPVDPQVLLEAQRARDLTPLYGRAMAAGGSSASAPPGTRAIGRLSLSV